MQPVKRDNEHPAVARILDYSYLYAWGLIGGFVLIALPAFARTDYLRGFLGIVFAFGCLVWFDYGRREETKGTVLFGKSRQQIIASGVIWKAAISVLAFGFSLQAPAWFQGYLAILLSFGGLIIAPGIMWLHYRSLE